jgi:hypothetical protein
MTEDMFTSPDDDGLMRPSSPTKPKGMHGKTVADLLADLEDDRGEWEQAFDQRLREMTDRFGGLV